MRARSLYVVIGLQFAGLSAHADKHAPVPPPPSCRVLNNADHAVKLYDGFAVGSWRVFFGTQTITDGAQVLDLVCDAPDHVMKLVGTAGALKVEPMPMWFRAGGSWDGALWVAAKRGAKVAVDGKPVKLAKTDTTNVAFDARARLLASDLATVYDAAAHTDTWTLPVDVEMTAGKETATATIRITPFSAVKSLLTELQTANRKPVAWAAAPDKAGPAIIFGCEWSAAQKLPSYEIVRSPTKLTDLSLVAVCTTKFVKLGKCPPPEDKFAHGEQVERERRDGVVQLFEAKTGKELATTTLTGTEPAACRDTATQPIVGDPPSKRAIATWIDTVR